MLTLIQTIARRPWAIQGEVAAHVQGLIQREGIAGLRHLAELKRIAHAWDDDDDDRPGARRGGGRAPAGSTVAVVSILGTLTQRTEFINSAETRSTAEIAEEIQTAVADPKIDAVALDIDSPGGEVYGIPEAWQSIRDAAKAKPIVASANSVAASAALYLASAASEFWVTPSGEAGSVGVYALHVDASKALEAMGEAWDFIVADDSPHKVEGAPTGPLTPDARADLQKMVNRYMTMFVRDLARGRGVTMDHVRENFGRGRMLSPQDAVAVKMADRVGTFDDAVRRAAQLGRERREASAAARAEGGPADPLAIDVGPGAFASSWGCDQGRGHLCTYVGNPALPGDVAGWSCLNRPKPGAASTPESVGPTPEQLAALGRMRL
jgi:signal peptide peptidase SppA